MTEAEKAEKLDRLAEILSGLKPDRLDAFGVYLEREAKRETRSMTKRRKGTPPRLPTLTEMIRVTIVKRGLTAYRVAKTIGTSPVVIQRFLNHERDLKGVTLDKLAAALGLSLTETETGHPDLKGAD
jgi:hypothetical protein